MTLTNSILLYAIIRADASLPDRAKYSKCFVLEIPEKRIEKFLTNELSICFLEASGN